MNKRLSLCFMSLLVIFLVPYTAMAAPVIFTHSGMGSGSLDGVNFASTSFTITAYGDTDNVNSSSLLADFFTYHDSAFITIDGSGTFEFLIPTQTWLDEGQVGFGWYNESSDDLGMNLFVGPTDSGGFVGWQMQTSIGPLTGSGYHSVQWSFDDVVTTGGILIFDQANNIETTFSATVVPVPATILLLFSGLAGLVGIRSKFKK